MALVDGLKPLADKYLGAAYWAAHSPRQTCYALMAKAYVERWSIYAPESVFLIQCWQWLRLPQMIGVV